MSAIRAREPHQSIIDTEDGVKLHVKVWPVRSNRPPCLTKPIMAVLVHQWSKMGGCQTIMRGLAMHLLNQGLSVVTFNMRGVGQSTGHSTFNGRREVKDVESVCKWAYNTYDQNILLIGSSAGAVIAGSALDSHPHIKAYVGIGYLLGMWASLIFGGHHTALIESRKPKLFLMGAKDGFSSVHQLEEFMLSSHSQADMHIFPGVGHFELEAQEYDAHIAFEIMRWIIKTAPTLCS